VLTSSKEEEKDTDLVIRIENLIPVTMFKIRNNVDKLPNAVNEIPNS
jgi:hypothetical protein